MPFYISSEGIYLVRDVRWCGLVFRLFRSALHLWCTPKWSAMNKCISATLTVRADKRRMRNSRRTRGWLKKGAKLLFALQIVSNVRCILLNVGPVSICIWNIRVNKLLSECVHLSSLLLTLPNRLADTAGNRFRECYSYEIAQSNRMNTNSMVFHVDLQWNIHWTGYVFLW